MYFFHVQTMDESESYELHFDEGGICGFVLENGLY